MVSTLYPLGLNDDISPYTTDSGSKLPETSQVELYGADEETLIRLLRSKIKYALAETGFDQIAQTTVGRLVERNVISCGVALRGAATRGNLLEVDLVQSQLEGLMAGGFHINSNEPVLLILIDCQSAIPTEVVNDIKVASCTVLGTRYGIFPVRVYIAMHPAEKVGTGESWEGFSLALLNVCNTDIGGPSMIQLLDSEAASLDWKRMIVISEAWNRTQLYWRKDVRPISKTPQNCDDITDADTSIPKDIEDDLQVTTVNMTQIRDQFGFADAPPPCDTEHEYEQQSSVTESYVEAENPTMASTLAWQDSRPAIQHPTWAHSSGGESLIDMVARQASEVSDTDTNTHA